jgi:adenylate cyclase
LDRPVEVSELLPPAGEEGALSDGDLTRYEEALDAFLAGQWQAAFRKLHQITADDCAKDFLTVHIARHGRVPPANWEGVIRLE